MTKNITIIGNSSTVLTDILKGTDYALTIFSKAQIGWIEILEKNGKPYLKCRASDKLRPAKPEEIVRQLYLQKLIAEYGAKGSKKHSCYCGVDVLSEGMGTRERRSKGATTDSYDLREGYWYLRLARLSRLLDYQRNSARVTPYE